MKRTLSLGQKLAAGFSLCTVITAAFCGYTLWQVKTLGAEQEYGAARAKDALAALEASQMAEHDYSIIADLIINRNFEEGTRDWAEAKSMNLRQLETVEKLAETPSEKENVRAAKEAWSEMVRLVDKELLPLLGEKNPNFERISKIDYEIDLRKKLISGKLKGLSEHLSGKSGQADREFHQTQKSVFLVSILAGLLAIIVAAATALAIIRSVTSRVRRVTEALSIGSSEVSSAAAKIAESGTELSSSVTEQASAVQESVSSLEEVNAMVRKNAENAKKSLAVSQESKEAADRGKVSVQSVIEAIREIRRSHDEMNSEMLESNARLTEITQLISEIGEKTRVINDIVFQTKLLSFNASVEAARAGEQGKGFAVVAEEVGNLAQMSGNAAKEISGLLEGSTRKVQDIISLTTTRVQQLASAGEEKIQVGTETATRCDSLLDEIVASVTSVVQLVEEIADASEEQAQGVQEIVKAMGQLDQVTHQNTVVSERTATAGRQLDAQAESLAQQVKDLREVVEGSVAISTPGVLESQPEPQSSKKPRFSSISA
ncbi:MAG: methyl-accepting chemotaxis protein [Oligoflexia bacterium]|nr:methyl-accepting chemotaxis protein [Oligoflexia bacterium]